MVDYADLIGVPFVYRGRTVESGLDCYGLVKILYQRMHAIALPDYITPTEQGEQAAVIATQLPLWAEVPQAEGTVVALRVGRYISHCGFMVESDRVAHSWEKTGGVTVQPIEIWTNRILGFYTYAG